MTTTAHALAPLAPAIYAGFQEGFGRIPGIELFNLTADILGHCAGSTVSRQTLENAGYRIPAVCTAPMRERRRAAWYFRNHAA